MKDKTYDFLRKLQWLIPALTTLYGVVDTTFAIGAADIVCTLSAAVVAFIGVVLQHESDTYFAEKDIVQKVEPVEEAEAEG